MSRTVRRIGKWLGIVVVIGILALAVTYPVVDMTRSRLDDTARTQLLSEGKAGQFVTTSQGVMHVRVSGPANGPVLLLVHGGVVGGYGFDNWQQPLAAAGYRVLVPDLLGYGYSDRPDVTYDRAFYMKQLTELLDGLGITTKVNLVGASFGGGIVTAFTAENPARVASVAMMAPAGGGRVPLVPAEFMLWPVVGDWIFRVVGPSTVTNQMNTAYANSPNRAAMESWMGEQTRYRGFGEGMLHALRDYDSGWQPDAIDGVGRSGVPTMLVWGTADAVHPYALSKEWTTRIPQAKLVTLEGAGHAITYGRAADVIAAYLPFLADAGAAG